MGKGKIRKRPLEPRKQVGALPFRRQADGSLEIMLVTSRETQRWIIPKGWPITGLKSHEAAAREALEEAGLVGGVAKKPIGHYSYWKRRPDSFLLCNVAVFPLAVDRQLPSWPEQHQRRSQWFSQQDASDLVDEPALGAIIRNLRIGPISAFRS